MSATTTHTNTPEVACAGTSERCVNTCTNPCYNGQYAVRVEYGPGHADYLTVNCGCAGRPCWACEIEEIDEYGNEECWD